MGLTADRERTSLDASEDPEEVLAELRTLASLAAGVADALSLALNLGDAVQRCADAIVRGLDAAFARIWTLNEQQNILELQASAGLYTHLDGPHSRVPLGHFKIGLIALERKPHLTNSVVGDPRVNDQDWARREGMVAFAGYPLLVAGQVVGVMALFARRPLTAATLDALASVANSIAHGIQHWRTVESLHASEERFALAVQGTAEGVWDWNVLTNEVYFSAQFKSLLGYTEQELEDTYDAWESRLHPEDREHTLQTLQKHLEQRERFQVDYRLRTKSGVYRWFQARGQAVWAAIGRPVRMLGSIRDITARKLSEARLAAEHRVTQILAESAELPDVLPRIMKTLCTDLNWDVAAFWVCDRHDEALHLAHFCRRADVTVPDFEEASHQCFFERGVGLPGRTWTEERPVWIEDVARDANFSRTAATVRDDLHGAAAFPILIRGKVYGVMEFFSHRILKPDMELLNGLAAISLQFSQSIETQQKQQTILRNRQELAIARRIQKRTFPNVMPNLAGFDIAGASRPATATGGDYFDFVPQPGHELLFALGDVCGHGLGPALVAAGAHASVRILNMMDTGIEKTIQLLNERIYEDTDQEFMTLFLGVLNPSNHTLNYYNAGHCPGIILDSHGAVRTRLPSNDLPLGLISDHELRHGEVSQLVSGDLLLIHTDGIFEAFCPKGELFGMTRVLETIRAARHLPAAAIISTLFRAVRKFSQTALSDDMTAILIKVD